MVDWRRDTAACFNAYLVSGLLFCFVLLCFALFFSHIQNLETSSAARCILHWCGVKQKMSWKDSFVGDDDTSLAKLSELMPHTRFCFMQKWMAHARLFTLMTDRTIGQMEELLEWFWTEHDNAWHATLKTMRLELEAARTLLMAQPRLQIVATRPHHVGDIGDEIDNDDTLIFELYGVTDEPISITDRVTLLPVATTGKFLIQDAMFPGAGPMTLFDHCTVPHLNWTVRCNLNAHHHQHTKNE
jgi:hypothetical protein